MHHTYQMKYMTQLQNQQIKNKMFHDVNLEFLDYGWELKENTMDTIVYTHPIYPTDEFKIKMNNKHIKVTIPVVSSNIEYSASFTSYYQASEYLLFHLNYHSKINI